MNQNEVIVWSAAFAERFGRERHSGRDSVESARRAVIHATGSVAALREAKKLVQAGPPADALRVILGGP